MVHSISELSYEIDWFVFVPITLWWSVNVSKLSNGRYVHMYVWRINNIESSDLKTYFLNIKIGNT